MAANKSATCSGTEMQPHQTKDSAGIEGHGYGELIILITTLPSLFFGDWRDKMLAHSDEKYRCHHTLVLL